MRFQNDWSTGTRRPTASSWSRPRRSADYDYVILGASHAAALGYQDMTARLEEMTGASIINLSVVGGGVRVSRLVLRLFPGRASAPTLVYVVDSFAFYSKQWNEERLQDTRLFLRAPFDPRAGRLLLGDRSPVDGVRLRHRVFQDQQPRPLCRRT